MSTKDATKLVHAGRYLDANHHYVNPPVIRASTVLHENVAVMLSREENRHLGIRDIPTYGTQGSPTHDAFFEALKELEGGAGAWAFSTGLGACTIPLMAFVKAGDHALLVDSIYGPTREFAEEVLTKFGVEIEFFDPRMGADVEKLFRPNTTMLMMETPGSHSFELMDVPAIARVCQKHNVISLIDNTWATPLYFKPLQHGVDVVIHAATKFIAGHSDVLMGVVIANERAWPALKKVVYQCGQFSSPDDIYLAYRGLHTMAARLQFQSETTRRVVQWFQSRPEVERVLWPALETDPSHEIWKRDFTGATSLFAVVFKPEYNQQLTPMIDALKLFGRGYSWGGYESLLIRGYGKRTVKAMPFERMVRVYVGMEDADDLIADLTQAIEKLEPLTP